MRPEYGQQPLLCGPAARRQEALDGFSQFFIVERADTDETDSRQAIVRRKGPHPACHCVPFRGVATKIVRSVAQKQERPRLTPVAARPTCHYELLNGCHLLWGEALIQSIHIY